MSLTAVAAPEILRCDVFYFMECFCIVTVECTCVDAYACAEVVYGVVE
jgi:hypothetical protein